MSPVELPADLEGWLRASEAAVPDLVPGTGKRIVWAGEAGASTELSVVYVHGFSASRQETRPLAERVAAELGANLFLTRLTGHGRTGDALARATAGDWLHDTEEALAIGGRIGERIVLIGTSQGGTLATWAAARSRRRDGLEALVLVSPNFGPRDSRAEMLTWPWGGLLARLAEGETRSWEPVNERQARYWTESYPTRALLPMMALVEFVRSEVDPESITVPALLVYSPGDEVVDSRLALERFRKFASERKETLRILDSGDPYDHVLAGDVLSPGTTGRVARTIVDFVREGG